MLNLSLGENMVFNLKIQAVATTTSASEQFGNFSESKIQTMFELIEGIQNQFLQSLKVNKVDEANEVDKIGNDKIKKINFLQLRFDEKPSYIDDKLDLLKKILLLAKLTPEEIDQKILEAKREILKLLSPENRNFLLNNTNPNETTNAPNNNFINGIDEILANALRDLSLQNSQYSKLFIICNNDRNTCFNKLLKLLKEFKLEDFQNNQKNNQENNLLKLGTFVAKLICDQPITIETPDDFMDFLLEPKNPKTTELRDEFSKYLRTHVENLDRENLSKNQKNSIEIFIGCLNVFGVYYQRFANEKKDKTWKDSAKATIALLNKFPELFNDLFNDEFGQLLSNILASGEQIIQIMNLVNAIVMYQNNIINTDFLKELTKILLNKKEVSLGDQINLLALLIAHSCDKNLEGSPYFINKETSNQLKQLMQDRKESLLNPNQQQQLNPNQQQQSLNQQPLNQ